MTDLFKEINHDGTDQDYAPIWKPHEQDVDRTKLVGIVGRMHSAPADWQGRNGERPTIYTVISLGNDYESDFKRAKCRSLPTHKDLTHSRLQSVHIGDLVMIEYEGAEEADNGYESYQYTVNVRPQSAWEESEYAREIEQLIDEHKQDGGWWGDDRSRGTGTALQESGGAFNRANDSRTDQEDGPFENLSRDSSDVVNKTAADESSESDAIEATQVVDDFLELYNGSVDIDDVRRVYVEVREFDTNLEDAVDFAGAQLTDDGKIVRRE